VSLEIIGDFPLATDAQGNLKSRIGTVFPSAGVVITLPKMSHALQRIHYTSHLDRLRAAQGLHPLSDSDKDRIWDDGVDLIMTGRDIQIRPEPDKMPLAFRADERLQEIASKRRIRFLRAREANVQQAIRERGEYWRICPYPLDEKEILASIAKSKIALGGQAIYYYCAETGTRLLTCHAFDQLAKMTDEDLRLHLIEIRDYAVMRNRLNQYEVSFFAVDATFEGKGFAGLAFEQASPLQLRKWHADLAERFRQAVPPGLHIDNPDIPGWRNRLFACLMDEQNDTLAGSVVSDLTPEFFRMVRWLPGGRIENGELIFDPLFGDRVKYRDDQELATLCDERVKGFIGNYVREFGSLQYVNIGWVTPSISRRHRDNGHRVYIAEVMYRGADRPVLRILRIQQWGVREHLNAGKDYGWAASQSTEYTEYTLDRRLACWELGMSLPSKIDTRLLIGRYDGVYASKYRDLRIWTVYYERDFIKGLATDKIPDAFLADPAYALSIARLLGHAAAPNMVVGRTVEENSTEVVFDNGDEMILSDADGQPQRIVVADHAGTFHDYRSPLDVFAAGYAKPVSSRSHKVPDPAAFEETYLTALSERLFKMQVECRQQRNAFNALFQNSKQGDKTFADRWAKARERLENTDVPALMSRIREKIREQPCAEMQVKNRG